MEGGMGSEEESVREGKWSFRMREGMVWRI